MRRERLAAFAALACVGLVAACAQGLTKDDPQGWPGEGGAADHGGVPEGGSVGSEGGPFEDGSAADDGAGDASAPDGTSGTGDGPTSSADAPATTLDAPSTLDSSTKVEASTCTGGGACVPTNVCHTGIVDCSSGSPVCTDTGTSLADGTACSSVSVCMGGVCNSCGALGDYCCAGDTCAAAPQTCISAAASSCRTNVSPQCTCGALYPGMQLTTGQQIDSCDDRFDLVLQGDGNLVLYESSTPLWSSNTAGTAASVATMQDDGNFVLYASGGVALWSTVTGGTGCGTYVTVQNDGNFVAYGSGGVPLWASNTGGH